MFFYRNINVKENGFFFRARAEKDIARHIDSSSVIWTLINNGKLANQIARSAASVVKWRIYERLEGLQGTKASADGILILGDCNAIKEATSNHDAPLSFLLKRCQQKQTKRSQVPAEEDWVIVLGGDADRQRSQTRSMETRSIQAVPAQPTRRKYEEHLPLWPTCLDSLKISQPNRHY